MVREIGEIYGFNINEINKEFNCYLMDIKDKVKKYGPFRLSDIQNIK